MPTTDSPHDPSPDSPTSARLGARPAATFRQAFWQKCVLALMRGAAWGLQRTSRRGAMRFGRGLGRVAYRAAGRQRKCADRNLRLAYGAAMSQGERDALTRRVFESFSKTVVDFLRMPAQKPADVERLISAEGWEHVEAALAGGRGVIFVTGHLGNWEVIGQWIAARGVRLTVVVREPNYPPLRDFIYDIHQHIGCDTLDKGGSARELLRRLRRGEAIGILADQNHGDVFVPFFGVPAGTTTGPASLALMAGAPIVPSYCVRMEDDTYRAVFLEAIPVEKTRDRKAESERLTEQVNAALEAAVRQYPDQWLWIHNRWKSAFQETNRDRWPEGCDYVAARARWDGSSLL